MEKKQVGPFQIVKRLGTNRRQHVYHARQTEQNRDVALKFIKIPPNIDWSDALDKINREVQELQKLKHPNLIRVYGAGVEDDQIFFATELIKGESIASMLSRRGRLSPDLVVDYGRQIAEVLHYLHKHELVHSKLTPDKLLITPDNQVKIADLRLNRPKRRRWDSGGRRNLELAAYMAPEQFTEAATQKSDFYSLGVILYEMLTGKLPVEPDTIGRLAKTKQTAPVPSVSQSIMNCPVWLDKIVTQLLQPTPRQRPHSARAITFAFDEIKKIETTGKSAVSQVSGNFNPLTAGADKSEANRLLGNKPAKSAKEDRGPFYERTGFQIVALIAIAALIIGMMIPRSETALMNEYRAEVESNDPEQWKEAALGLKEIMDRSSSSNQEEAADLYFQARQQTLVLIAEEGILNVLQSDNMQKLVKAVQMQKAGQDVEAMEAFQRLASSVDPEGDDRHIYNESMERILSLAESMELPDDPELITKLIEMTDSAETRPELSKAEVLLGRVTIKFANESSFKSIREEAMKRLIEVRKSIAIIEGQAQAESEAE